MRSNRIKSATIQESPTGTEIIAINYRRPPRATLTATYLTVSPVGDLINNGVKFDVKAARRRFKLLMTLLVS